MRQNTTATEATLEQHQHAWADYRDRLQRGRRELSDLNTAAPTDTERNRLAAKTEALEYVFERWVRENTTLNADATASQYTDLWTFFGLDTYLDWARAYRAGEAGDLIRAAYATGLALALDYQRGYGYGIDPPNYIADFFTLNPPN